MTYKKYQKKHTSSIFDLVIKLPWWINLFLSILTVSAPYLLKSKIMVTKNMLIINNYSIIYFIAFILAFIFFISSLITFLKVRKEKQIFDKQNNIKDLYSIKWDTFEILVREVFSRSGHKVKIRGGNRPDGGVDLEAYKEGKKIIIQCKQWKSNKVGVAIVREMFGVMIHEKAQSVYIITCGSFTKDAKEFAKGKPIHLIHGFKLLDWIKEIKNN